MKDNLPIVHPKYGGILTYYHELPIDTIFFVCNGNWEGEIVEIENSKCIFVYYTGEIRSITENDFAWLELRNK